MTDFLDTYSRQARLFPALIALLVLFVTIAAWVPNLYDFAAGIVGLFIASGVTVLFAHVVRSMGRKIESELYSSWGGKPTTLWLRHKDSHLDAVTKSRYHATLSRLIGRWNAPTEIMETQDPESSDVIYDSAVRWLREKTRDRKHYPLVFKENVSYGFRRNIYGIKPIGITLAIVCTIGNIGALYYHITYSSAEIPMQGIGSFVLSILFVVGWICIVKRDWVRDAADAYARALLAYCDQCSACSDE